VLIIAPLSAEAQATRLAIGWPRSGPRRGRSVPWRVPRGLRELGGSQADVRPDMALAEGHADRLPCSPLSSRHKVDVTSQAAECGGGRPRRRRNTVPIVMTGSIDAVETDSSRLAHPGGTSRD